MSYGTFVSIDSYYYSILLVLCEIYYEIIIMYINEKLNKILNSFYILGLEFLILRNIQII